MKKKKLLAIVLALSLIAPCLPTWDGTEVQADSGTDPYGFSLTASDEFNKAKPGDNPYGSGNFALSPISETFLMRSSDQGYYATWYNNEYDDDEKNENSNLNKKTSPMQNGALSGSATTVASSRGEFSDSLVQIKAFDPTGSGHDDMVASVGLNNKQISIRLFDAKSGSEKAAKTVSVSNTWTEEDTQKDNPETGSGKGDGNNTDWFDNIEQWEYTSFFALTAGDFDGNGDDELAVYIPYRAKPQVRIYDVSGSSLTQKQVIYYDYNERPALDKDGNKTGKMESVEFMSSWANISGKFSNDGRTERAMLQASLDADDVDRDGRDELVLVGSYADMHDDGDSKQVTDRSSRLAVFKADGTEDAEGGSKIHDWRLYPLGSAFKLQDAEGDAQTNMRTTSCALGDIDFDGFPEIVAAGYFTSGTNAMSDDLNESQYAITTIDFNERTESLQQGGIFQVDVNPLMKDGTNHGDTILDPPALVCAKTEGMNAAERVFLEGVLYQFDNTFEEVTKGKDYDDDDDAIGSYVVSTVWCESAVAGNFDGNPLGVEQIMYTTGYKQYVAWPEYFYYVGIIGQTLEKKTQESTGQPITAVTGTYYTTEQNVHYHEFPSVFAALAAVDVDDDTEIYEYTKNKEYTYSDVSVLALLQAAPYFEDLQENYPDNVGKTAFGLTEGSGQSTIETKEASAGAYVSWSAGNKFAKHVGEAAYTHGWQWEDEKELHTEYEVDFEGGYQENSIVLYRTPVTLYYYSVTPPGGTPYSMAVGIQDKPVYIIMNVDDYNELAEKDNLLKDKVITKNILSSEVGRPETYDTSPAGLRGFTGAKNFVVNKPGTTSSTTQSITTGEQTSSSQTYTNNFELKLGFELSFESPDPDGAQGSFGAGVTAGGGWGGGKTEYNYNDVSKGGTVATAPTTDYGYQFEWKFGTWRVNVGGNDIPVLGYLVRNVVAPPSLPRNVAINTVTSDSVTLTWESGSRPPLTYEIYQHFDDNVGDGGYVLIATVDAQESEEDGSYKFVYEGLSPGESYELALRSVGKDSEGNRMASELTPVVTGTTLSEGDGPTIYSIEGPGSVSAGDKAVFTVDAAPSDGVMGGLSYKWQTRAAGSSKWENMEDVGSTSKLTLTATEEMDGSHYRCIVSEVKQGVRSYVYSEAVTLLVGKAGTTVDVTAESAVNNDNVGVPSWTETTDEESEYETTKEVVVEIDGEKETFIEYENTIEDAEPDKIYQSLSSAAAAGDEEGKGTSDAGTFYVLENPDIKDDGKGNWSGTASKKVPLTPAEVYFATDTEGKQPLKMKESDEAGENLTPDALHGPQKTYVDGGVKDDDGVETGGTTYKVFSASKNETDSTETLYLYQKDGESGYHTLVNDEISTATQDYTGYTIEPVYGSAGTMTKGSGDDATEYKVWYYTDSEGEEQTLYELVKDDATKYYQYAPAASADPAVSPSPAETPEPELQEVYLVGEGMLSGKGEGDPEAEYSAKVGDVCTATKKVTTQKSEPKDGEEVTLTATLGPEDKAFSGSVTFRITNNRTGGVESVVGVIEGHTATAKWTPSSEGDYTITAVYGGSETLIGSQDDCIYYALIDKEDDAYVLEGGGDVIYGEPIELQPKKLNKANGSTENVASDDVTYIAVYTDESGQSTTLGDFNPAVTHEPGTYLIQATIGGKGTASRSVKVLKRPITFTAPSDKVEYEAVGSAPSIDAVEPVYTGDETENKQAILERDNTYTAKDMLDIATTPDYTGEMPPVNAYTTSLNWKREGVDEEENADYIDLVKQCLQKYSVTLETGLWEVTETKGTSAVTFEAGSNGRITGYMGDSSIAFTSGATVANGEKVAFTASPDENFEVDRWTVTGADGKELTEGTDYTINGKRLVISSLQQDVHVKVTFRQISCKLNYSVADNEGDNEGGTIEACFLTESGAEDDPIVSGDSILSGSSVRLTARPDEEHVISGWTVNGKTQENDDGTDYTDSMLELKNISGKETLNVQVKFAKKEYYKVETSVTASDDEGNAQSAAGIQIEVDGLAKNGEAEKGSTLTFTAKLPNSSTSVQEWRLYHEDGTTYDVVAGNAETYVMHNVTAKVKLELVVKLLKTYELEYEALVENTEKVEGVLTASSGTEKVASGARYSAYIPVDFAAEVPDDKQISDWTVQEGRNTEAEPQNTTEDHLSIDKLSRYTKVTLLLEQKPMFTYEEAENGKVESGLASGSYLLKHSEDPLTLTLTPAEGYELDQKKTAVTGAKADYAPADDSDAVTLTLTPEGEDGFTKDITVKPVFAKIPSVGTVTFAIQDLNESLESQGTVSITAKRKNMECYKRESSAADSTKIENVYRDSEVTFKVEPVAAYEAYKWFVNGVEVTAGVSDGDSRRDTLTMTITEPAETLNVEVELAPVGNKLIYGAVNALAGDTARPGGTVTAVNNVTNEPFTSGKLLGTDSSMTFTAEPAEGYELIGWKLNDEVVEGETQTTYTTTVVAESETTVYAVFDRIQYKVEWTAEGGTVTAVNTSEDNEAVENGASVRGGRSLTFTAEALPGMAFESWTVNGEPREGSDPNLTVTLEEDLTIAAAFRPDANCPVTYLVSGNVGGTISATKGEEEFKSGDMAAAGDTIVFHATPAEYYCVKSWTVNGEPVEGTGEDCTLKVGTDRDSYNVVVTFEPAKNDLTFGWKGEGTVSAAVDGIAVTSGEKVSSYSEVTFTAEPAEGYIVGGWYSDEACTQQIEGTEMEQNTYTIEELLGGASVYVEFIPNPTYKVTVKAKGNGNGTLTVELDGEAAELTDDTIEVPRHSTLKVTAEPHDKYNTFNGWTVDNESVGKDSTSYELKDVKEGHEIEAAFGAAEMIEVTFKIPEELSKNDASVEVGYVDEAENSQVINAVNQKVRVVAGQSLWFKINPPKDKMVDEWTVQEDGGTALAALFGAAEETQKELGNTLVLEEVTESITVSVSLTDLVTYSIESVGTKAEEQGCTVEDLTLNPDITGSKDEIREGGSITFTVRPPEGKMITEMKDNNGDDEHNILTCEQNEDGSYTVTISNITEEVDFEMTAVTVHTLTYENPIGGTIKVTDEDGNVIESGSKVPENEELTVTADLDSRYEIVGWGGDATGNSASLTITMDGDKTLSLTLRPKKGSIFTVDKLKYKVTNKDTSGKGTVQLTGAEKSFKETTLTVPKTVKIGGYTYKVTSIGKRAFEGNKTLKTLNTGSSVKVINSRAFYGSSLKKAVIGNAVEEIKDSAFYACKNLATVTIGKNVVTIGTHAFCHGYKAKKITIKSKKLKTVKGEQFHSCRVTLTVPKKYYTKYKKMIKLLEKRCIKKWIKA